jgi:hypothetical protein
MYRLFLIVAASACASLPALGAPFTVFGAPDCGQWAGNPTQTRKAWLLGFMSGLSGQHMTLRPTAKDPLDRVSSAEQIFVWMDNYCKAKPLSRVETGGLDLFDELRAQAK